MDWWLDHVVEVRRSGENLVEILLDIDATEDMCRDLERGVGVRLNCYPDGRKLNVFLRSSSGLKVRVEGVSMDELYEMIYQFATGELINPSDKALYVRYVSLRPNTIVYVLKHVERQLDKYDRGEVDRVPSLVLRMFEKAASRITSLEKLMSRMKRRNNVVLNRYVKRIEEMIDLAYSVARRLERIEEKRVKK